MTQVKEDRCPKCNTTKSAESCPKCGLVFAKFNAEAMLEGVPEEVKLLWKAVEENWDKQSCHAVFMERALAAKAGGYAAACYRTRSDDPIARENLESISKRLEQMLLAGASQRKSNRYLGRFVGVILLLVILLCLAYFFMKFSVPSKG